MALSRVNLLRSKSSVCTCVPRAQRWLSRRRRRVSPFSDPSTAPMPPPTIAPGSPSRRPPSKMPTPPPIAMFAPRDGFSSYFLGIVLPLGLRPARDNEVAALVGHAVGVDLIILIGSKGKRSARHLIVRARAVDR